MTVYCLKVLTLYMTWYAILSKLYYVKDIYVNTSENPKKKIKAGARSNMSITTIKRKTTRKQKKKKY